LPWTNEEEEESTNGSRGILVVPPHSFTRLGGDQRGRAASPPTITTIKTSLTTMAPIATSDSNGNASQWANESFAHIIDGKAYEQKNAELLDVINPATET
jgi:hypothetical protein